VLNTFYVNYDGSIVLLRPLTASDNSFQFTVRVTDDRTPFAKHKDGVVTINIQHVKCSPAFQQTSYEQTIPLERLTTTTPILTVVATDCNLAVSSLLSKAFERDAGVIGILSQADVLEW
jgi:hypothetical protein